MPLQTLRPGYFDMKIISVRPEAHYRIDGVKQGEGLLQQDGDYRYYLGLLNEERRSRNLPIEIEQCYAH